MSALVARDVHASYGPYKALTGLTLEVAAGEAVAVLGRNGVGKSTFARVVSGLVPVTAGTVELFGRSITRTSPSRIARQGVVHLPEGVGLFSGLSIEENLQLRVGGRTRRERADRLDRALGAIGELADRRRQRAGTLSGGQQRLVAISGAIAAEPRLLVADEPALGLSPAAADAVYEALGELARSAVTVIIIETRLGRVDALCPRAIVMSGGAATFDGPTAEAAHVLATILPVGHAAVAVPFDFPVDAGGGLPEASPSRTRRWRSRGRTT